MSSLSITDRLFFESEDFDKSAVEGLVSDTLRGADDGELFLEYAQSESVSLDDGKIKNAAYNTTHGFGLRRINDEATGYAHSSVLTLEALRRAASGVQAIAIYDEAHEAVRPVATAAAE